MGTLIESVQAEPLTSGYMADVYRLHLEAVAAPATVILKLPSSDATRRSEAAAFNSYGKESYFYRELAPTLDVRVPHCFYNPADHFCLIIEDMGERSADVEPGEAMDTLASLHAATTTGYSIPELESGFVAADSLLKARSSEFLKETTAGQAKDILSTYCNNTLVCLPRLLAFPQVLSHMDYREDNLIRNHQGLTLLDWGEFCLAPRGFDIASAIISFASSSERQRDEQRWLTTYAEKACVPLDEVFDGYRLALLPLVYLPMLMQIRGSGGPAAALKERLFSAVEDHAAFLNECLHG